VPFPGLISNALISNFEIKFVLNNGRNKFSFSCPCGLSDTILKGIHPGTIPARFGLIWFCGFRGKDLNVIFYQNMHNLHNRYKSAERKISQKYLEYMLNYSFPCSCSKHFSSFRFIIKQQWQKLTWPLAWWAKNTLNVRKWYNMDEINWYHIQYLVSFFTLFFHFFFN
jgi:hypothetical protein